MKLLDRIEIKDIFKKQECEEVKVEEVKDLIKTGEEMINFCLENNGVMKKFFVWMNSYNSFQIVFNPTYYPEKKVTNVIESCLTYNGENFYLKRYKDLRAVFYTFHEEKLIKNSVHLIGERAFIFQHEYDHLFNRTVADIGVSIEN